MKWKLIVILACLVVILAFAIIFRLHQSGPYLFFTPYILWSGILVTAAMVVLTYLGARYFPHKDL